MPLFTLTEVGIKTEIAKEITEEVVEEETSEVVEYKVMKILKQTEGN